MENEYQKDPDWSKHKMRELAEQLSLKESQIYKWNWDRRLKQYKKLMKQIENNDI